MPALPCGSKTWRLYMADALRNDHASSTRRASTPTQLMLRDHPDQYIQTINHSMDDFKEYCSVMHIVCSDICLSASQLRRPRPTDKAPQPQSEEPGLAKQAPSCVPDLAEAYERSTRPLRSHVNVHCRGRSPGGVGQRPCSIAQRGRPVCLCDCNEPRTICSVLFTRSRVAVGACAA